MSSAFSYEDAYKPVAPEPEKPVAFSYEEAYPDAAKPEKPAVKGVLGTLAEGTKSSARAVGAAFDAFTDDADEVVAAAGAQKAAPKHASLERFYQDIEARKEGLGDDPGVWDSVKAVGGAVIDNPGGAGHALVEQLPNSAVSLGGAYAGMKSGAAAGNRIGGVRGAAVGGVLGGIAGMFAGNTAIETGFKAMEAADDGVFTPDERGQVMREGAVKGGVITGVDVATLGASKWILGATGRAMSSAAEVATRKALTDAGVDVTNRAAVQAATQNPVISAAVNQAQASAREAARLATDTFAKTAVRMGAAGALETVGEGVGEYLGELAATGRADMVDAVLESVLSLGQSGAEMAWSMARNRDEVAAQQQPPGAPPAAAGQGAPPIAPEPASPQQSAIDRMTQLGELPQRTPAEERELSALRTQSTLDPNAGPLSKAATRANSEEIISAAQSSADEMTMRLQAANALLSVDTLQQVRAEMGPEAVRDLMQSYHIARNPALDDVSRRRALHEVEAFWQSAEQTRADQAAEFSEFLTQEATDLTRRLSAPAWSEMKGVDAGFDPANRLRNQVPEDPRGSFSQLSEFSDFVDSERQDLSLRRDQAIERRRQEALRAEVELADADIRTLSADKQAAAANRLSVLESVLSDPTTVNPLGRFAAELRRQGMRNARPNEKEIALVERFSAAQQAFSQQVDQEIAQVGQVEQVAPNELDPYRAPGAPAAPVAPAAGRDKIAEFGGLMAQGWKIQNRSLVGPRGQKRNLNAAEFAAAREAGAQRAQQLIQGVQQNGPQESLGGEASTQTPTAPGGQSVLAEDTSDRLAVDAETVGNLHKSHPFIKKGFNALDRGTLAAVQRHMLRVRHNPQVFKSVVELIPVDVMDMLRRKQLTPEMLFDDPSMLNTGAVRGDRDNPVSIPVDGASAIISAVARVTAENLSFFQRTHSTGLTVDVRATNDAGIPTPVGVGGADANAPLSGALPAAEDLSARGDARRGADDNSPAVDTSMAGGHGQSPVYMSDGIVPQAPQGQQEAPATPDIRLDAPVAPASTPAAAKPASAPAQTFDTKAIDQAIKILLDRTNGNGSPDGMNGPENLAARTEVVSLLGGRSVADLTADPRHKFITSVAQMENLLHTAAGVTGDTIAARRTAFLDWIDARQTTNQPEGTTNADQRVDESPADAPQGVAAPAGGTTQAQQQTGEVKAPPKNALPAGVTTRRIKIDDNPAVEVTLPSGKVHRIERVAGAGSMALTGWHDADKGLKDYSYLGDTQQQAIAELMDREKRASDAKPADEQATRPKPGEEGYTLDLAREDLAASRAELKKQGEDGPAVDARLMDRIKRQEQLVAEYEADGQQDELDAEMQSYEAKGEAREQSEKEKWIKATVDKSRLNGSSGVQIEVAPNGGVIFNGDPNTSKDGRALLATYEKALAAGATQKEIAAALGQQDKAQDQTGKKRKLAEVIDNSATNPGEYIVSDAGTNLARFEIGQSGRPVKIKYFQEAQATRDVAREAMDAFIADRAASSQPEANPVSASDILKDAGLTITATKTRNGNDVWEVKGNTREHSETLKRLGGRWYGPKKAWSFYDADPSAKIAAAINPQATPTEQSGTKKTASTESSHHAAGAADFKAGKPRILPSYYTDGKSKNARDWYRGWDAANLESPAQDGGTPQAEVESRPARVTAATWDAAKPADRRVMLSSVGYTDADQARALSGFQWADLSDTVRKALDKPAAVQKPVTPQVLTTSQFNSAIQVAADSIDKLRSADVDRVITETPATHRLDMANRIKAARPDLAGEVDAVMGDLAGPAAPRSDSALVNDFLNGKRDTPPTPTEVEAEQSNVAFIKALTEARAQLPDGFSIVPERNSVALMEGGSYAVNGLGRNEAGIQEALRQAKLRAAAKSETPTAVDLRGKAPGDVLLNEYGEDYRIDEIDAKTGRVRMTKNRDKLSEQSVLLGQSEFDRLVLEDKENRPAPAKPSLQETVEPKSLEEMGAALSAGKRVHFDYAGADGRTLWIEGAGAGKGFVVKSMDDGNDTAWSKGGDPRRGGFSKDEAIAAALADAEYRFTQWKPVAQQQGEVDQILADKVKALTDNGVEQSQIEKAVAEYKEGDISLLDDLLVINVVRDKPERNDNPTDDEISAAFKKRLAERMAAQDKPKAPRKPRTKATGDKPATAPAAPRTRTAGQAAKSAAKNTFEGIAEFGDALGKLFGGNGRLSSGLSFDEETYAKAKPIFTAAYQKFKAAGADLLEVVERLVDYVFDSFGPHAAANMEPYVTQFVKDARDGKIDLGQEQQDNERTTLRGDGPQTLDEVAAEEGGGTEVRGAVGDNAADSGQAGLRAGAGVDAAGVPGARGGRGRAARTGATQARTRGRTGAVGEGRTQQDVAENDGRAEINGERVSAPGIPAQNFRITANLELGSGGEVQKFNDNLAAIRTLKQIEADNRRATPDEQAMLARYVGWGGLANAFPDPSSGEFKEKWKVRGEELRELLTDAEYKAARRSTRNAHYTSETVVSAIWKAVERMGFKGGLVLESSMGTGNFIGLAPQNSGARFVGIEYDSLTARIAQSLYPQATVLHSGFQKVPIADNSFALNIGNPPFGSESLRFQFKPELQGKSIHNQFFLAGMDALRPGGIQAMVVSRYLMDAQDTSSRAALAKQARLVAAIRLPDTAFRENARTDVVTDILFFQKMTPEEQASATAAVDAFMQSPSKNPYAEQTRQELAADAPAWLSTAEVRDPLGGEPMRVNAYFERNPQNIVGVMDRSGSMQHGADITVRLDDPSELAARLDAVIERLPANIQNLGAEVLSATEARFKSMSDALRIAINNEEDGHVKLDTDGKLQRVIERETPEGGFEYAFQEISAESPWSEQLTMDAEGRWYKLEVKTDADGNPVKQLGKDGKPGKRNLYERTTYATEADVPSSMRLGKAGFDRLKSMVKLRDLLKRQLTLETADAPKSEMDGNRKVLAKAYADFVAEHGPINRPVNLRIAMTMPDGGLVAALEVGYQPERTAAQSAKTGQEPQAEVATPAPILSERVVPKYEPAVSAKTAADALAITLAESGQVDIDRIASLLSVTNDEAIAQLQAGDSPLVFQDPETKRWETADIYLSGVVRRKLVAANLAGQEINIKALEKVLPEPWTAENVAVQLGSTWVPPEVYADFAKHLVGGGARVSFSALTNSYSLEVSGPFSSTAAEWGTDDVSGEYILGRLLNSQAPIVRRQDSDGKTYIDKDATALAGLKAREIAAEFGDWVFKDGDRRNQLVELFNEKFNTRVARQHNGQHLNLPGKVPDAIIKMRRHQMNAIWRGIYERFMLVDHAVGSGKTFTAIARAMERRRMGLSRKPMIVVPNHLVDQWQADVYRLYPGAKVLAAGKKDFEAKRRRRLFGKIATGDWDIVIVPHSSFGFIGISPDTEARYLEQEMAEAQAAIDEAWEQAKEDGADSGRRKPFGVKEAERLAEKIQNRMDKVTAGTRDRLLTFEQLGVDDLTVDEAHEFKNLYYSSRLTGVRGMGDKTGSRKANDLYNKVRSLRDSPTATVTFLTGTPISNSAVEMYTMLRYLAADALEEMGLNHFDAFRAQFVEATPAFEPTEGGRLKEVTRLGRTWSNMRSLMDLYYSVTDAVSLDDIKGWYSEDNNGAPFPVPKVKGGKDRELIAIKPTAAQEDELAAVMAGFDGLDNISDPYERNAARLRLMDRARKLSLDIRAVNPQSASREEGGKLEVVSQNIKRIYDQWNADRGTQLVFLDRSVPKAKGDDKVLKEYDALVAKRDAALSAGDEKALADAIEALERYDANEMAELRAAQTAGWNAYQQIKDNLIATGIPANEIRFVQEANNDEQKAALFAAVNGGKVRVLIGSTPRMGAGTNVQQRAVALHHVDVTWKPSDIEQREGRVIRQGNLLLAKYGPDFEVEILAYATERTVDAKMWDLNATKLRTINGIRKYNGDFTMEFDDEEAVSMAEMAALASGNPLLLERVKIESEINNLELLERSHRRKMYAIEDQLVRARKAVEQNPRMIEQAKARTELVRDRLGAIERRHEARTVTVEGKEYSTQADAMRAADEAVKFQQEGSDKARYAITIDGKRITTKDGIADTIHSALGDTSPFEATIGGETVYRRTEAARRVADALNNVQIDKDSSTVIGEAYGFTMTATVTASEAGKSKYAELVLTSGTDEIVSREVRKVELGSTFVAANLRPTFDSLQQALEYFANGHSEKRFADELERAQRDLPTLEEQAKQTFPKADVLTEKRKRLTEVVSNLSSSSTKDKDKSGDANAVRAPEGSYRSTIDVANLLDESDPYGNIDTRPGTREAQRDAGRDAMRALRRRLFGMRGEGRDSADGGAVSVLGATLHAGFQAGEANALTGQRIESPADLAALAQVYRDPRFETFRAIYVKDGKVVGEAGYSSRLPAVVALPQDMSKQIRTDLDRFGADGYYMLHNHPSGNASPSVPDLQLTNSIARDVAGFLGHVVIDHNEYAVIREGGKVQKFSAPELAATDYRENPAVKHMLLRAAVTNPRQVVQLGKALQIKGGHATLVLMSGERTNLIVDVPTSMLQTVDKASIARMKAVMRRMARESGSGHHRFMILPEGANIASFAALVTDGVVTDVVSADGRSLREQGTPYYGDFLNEKIPVKRVAEEGSPYSADAKNEDSFRDTERAYGGREAYDRAKAAGKTKLNYRQWVQVRTPAFKAWFGDFESDPANASKVVDPDTGEPLVVYHGTGGDISEFRVSERGEFGGGVYLTPDTAGASDYAIYRGRGPANVMPGYVTIKNPATAREASHIASWRGAENAQAEMIRRGYDGVIDMRSGQVVAFRPEQIKSATGNNGDFDGTNPDIRFSRTPRERATATPISTLSAAFKRAFPRLASAFDRMVQRGNDAQRGGVVFVENEAALAQAFADKTGRTLEEAQKALRFSRGGTLFHAVRSFVRSVRARASAGVFFDYLEVSAEAASKIKEKSGIDVAGYKHTITGDGVRHILKSHGDPATEEARGQTAITEDDLAQIPLIVQDFDFVKEGDTASDGTRSLVYQKTMGNGVTYYVEEVRVGRKKLAPKTMWKVGAAVPRTTPAGGVAHTSETSGSRTDPNLPDVMLSVNGTINGLYDPRSGLTFINQSAVTAETIGGVLLHEATHGKNRTKINAQAQVLLGQAKSLPPSMRAFIERVKARIEDAGETGNADEAPAYIVEQAAIEGRQEGFSAIDGKFMDWVDRAIGKRVGNLIRDFVAMIRAWGLRNRINLSQITVDDLVALAQSNIQAMSRGDAVRGGQAVSGSKGALDGTNQDIRLSRSGTSTRTADAFTDLSTEQTSLLDKIGAPDVSTTLKGWVAEKMDRGMTKIRQGLVDRYASLKDLDVQALGEDFIESDITNSAWVLSKMASGAMGAMSSMLQTGRLVFNPQQRLIGMQDNDDTGGLVKVLQGLGGGGAEVSRFFAWMAANRSQAIIDRHKRAVARAEEAKRELKNIKDMQALPGKTTKEVSELAEARAGWEAIIAREAPNLDVTERLFTQEEVTAGMKLNEGTTLDGADRATVYAQTFETFQKYRDDVVAIAEATGVISAEDRAMWKDEFYVPFYRVMAEEAVSGPTQTKGLSRQEAYKKLKGGKENLNDLLQNTLMNFNHLLTASLKNQAAAQAMQNAVKVGIARETTAQAASGAKNVTYVLQNGQRVFYEVDDPLVFESLTALSNPGINSTAVRMMAAFKRFFTNMTTVTPQFVIANTIRDLMQASATSPASKNVFKNFAQGVTQYRDEETRAKMLASGGAFSFGHLYGSDMNEVQASLQREMRNANLISSASMVPALLKAGWRKWADVTDAAENISRTAVFMQNQDKGVLRAAFEARDVMDFSQHGAWPAVQFLIRVVPFLNARLVGLDKLYRSGAKPLVLTAMGNATDGDKANAARFSIVTGALALASIMLYLANADDEEYQKLEDWQKDTYWFFRIGENAYFIPKPFEVGAISTMAERITEQFLDDKASGRLFRERMWAMLTQTFAFSPVPQMFQPALDVYSNVDAFTKRDIETVGMDRLSPGLRARDTTTAVAHGLSAVTRAFGDNSPVALSPVQVDHLIKGYLGAVGATAAGMTDVMWRSANGEVAPEKHWSEYQPIRRFYRDLGIPEANNRYGTLFYEGLRETNRIYADVRELQKMGRHEDAASLSERHAGKLAMRIELNRAQRDLTGISQRMRQVRSMTDVDGAWKRRELDLLRIRRTQITNRYGKQIEAERAA